MRREPAGDADASLELQTQNREAELLVAGFRTLIILLAVFAPSLLGLSGSYEVSEIWLVAVAGIDEESNSVIMQAPHISGFEGTRRAYDVKAGSAVQSLDDPKVVTFKQIDGHFGLEENGTATVTAETGVYNGNNNTLDLTEGIRMTTTSGYAARFDDARIDLANGTLKTDKPLELSTGEGSLRADSIEVLERGKRVIFRGNVSVTYMPPAELVTKSGEAEARDE